MKAIRLEVVGFVALAAIGCGGPPRPAAAAADDPSPAALSAADEAGVRAVDSAWAAAANRGDAAALSELYASDAVYQAPDAPPVTGRDAIAKEMTGLMQLKPAGMTLRTEKVEGRGDLAYAVGQFAMTVNGQTTTGHYAEVFKKQGDGSWKYAVDAWAMNGK
ncbi:MAG TPA: SgcJ/EcaC family oxidoreductase [Gemmatimonadales bacterium]|nr:SgcJ/EcaC family oxidoreductase [Gemmatimonadales bacterium]